MHPHGPFGNPALADRGRLWKSEWLLMKVLVTGFSGLAGYAAARALAAAGHEVCGLCGTHPVEAPGVGTRVADLGEGGAVETILAEEQPAVVVHCAAVSEPAACEADPEASRRMNVEVTARLAEGTRKHGFRLLHLSTDMVFDGLEGPWHPDSTRRPTTLYGQQKRDAEDAVLSEGHPERVVILRIPILTGNSPRGRRSVHEKLLTLFAEGRKATLFTDEERMPGHADDLAQALTQLGTREDLHGLHHWAGADITNRHAMGLAFLRHFDLPESWAEESRIADQPDFATRTRDLRLDTSALFAALGMTPVPLASQVARCTVPAWCDLTALRRGP